MLSGFNIYGYEPSLPAAIIFLILFSTATILHVLLTILTRRWTGIVVVLGGITEIIGWAGRATSSNDISSLVGYLSQEVCLIIGPTFFSATLYLYLKQAIDHATPPKNQKSSRLSGRGYSRLSGRGYVIVFVLCDIIALVLQGVGGGRAALLLEAGSNSTSGTNIMVGGIAFQLLSMICFSILALDFYCSVRKYRPEILSHHFNRFLLGIAIASVCILVRCFCKLC